MEVDVLVGLQWGSEGKGRVIQDIAHAYDCAVRVGGPNAGHTLYDDGFKVINRSIPCSWVNRDCKLVIGPGAAIRIPTLITELENIAARDPNIASRLFIDRNAVIIHRDDEAFEATELRGIASTAHGVGSAYMRKIQRKGSILMGMQHGMSIKLGPHEVPIVDTHHIMRKSSRLLVEGTQGTLLSLDHGDWPYVTSRNPIAASLLGDCGLPPRVRRVIGVARTFPIRVGGPSGPMGEEVTGELIAQFAGMSEPVAEFATVTGRPRRFAKLDMARLQRACNMNGVTDLVMTFADYININITRAVIRNYSDIVREFPEIAHFATSMARAANDSATAATAIVWGPLPNESAWVGGRWQ